MRSEVLRQDEIKERLATIPESGWVRLMREHYNKTGSFRARDLRRLLGDPKHGIEIGTKACLARYLSRNSKT